MTRKGAARPHYSNRNTQSTRFGKGAMTEEFTGWETTRLSKHFILLDFMADRAVYRSKLALPFGEIWNDERDELAKGLCNYLLEYLIESLGPFSVADAFWPETIANIRWPKRCKLGHRGSGGANGPKHLWAGGEATVDIALYDLVDSCESDDAKYTVRTLMNAVAGLASIDGCRDRVLGYCNTEFLCVTYKLSREKKRPRHVKNKL